MEKRDIKLTQMGFGLAQMLTTRQSFVCFDVTFCIRHRRVRLTLHYARVSCDVRKTLKLSRTHSKYINNLAAT